MKINNMLKKLPKTIKSIKSRIKEYIFKSKKGSLSWYLIFKIALKNLLVSRSRSLVTIGAIAVGTGVVVLLISFAYGLQGIVTKRLIQPNSLRLADVQTSSTAVALTNDKIKEIEKIPGVEKVAGAVSLAGSMGFGESKMDVIVLGTNNLYLDFAHINLVEGKIFSKKAEEKYYGRNDLQDLLSKMEKGEVAGVFEEKKAINIGDEISPEKIYFQLNDESYYPLREKPAMNSPILGFVHGSFLKKETGVEVWGGVYESVSTVGKFYQDKNGQWFGKWVKTTMPVFEELTGGLYQPKKDEGGTQVRLTGYLAEKDIKILSQEEIVLERQMEKLMNKFSSEGAVLGEATGEGELTALELEKETTASSQLKELVIAEKQKKQASVGAQLAIVEVKKTGGKEVLLSTALIRSLKITPKEIIGKTVSLAYILSGNLIPKVSGRVVTKPVNYQVSGVVKDDKNLLVVVPLADLESMGVSRFSLAKVLAKNETVLPLVREKIEAIGFTTLSIVDTLAQVNRLFRVMRFLLGAFGAIALVVAILGMFNTLTVSLLERTREVAVMKTLGTKEKDIARLFLAESVIIGLVGGFLGIILGVFLGSGINFLSGFWREDKTIKLFVSPWYFLVLILGISMIIGVFTGFYPSKRARKINPLEALRYE